MYLYLYRIMEKVYPLVSEKEKNDEKLKTILRWISKSPGVSPYKIDKETPIPRNVVMRKIHQYKLVDKGILKQKATYTGKRRAERFYITFKGIIYGLNIKAILPKDAAAIRAKSTYAGIRLVSECVYTNEPTVGNPLQLDDPLYQQMSELIPQSWVSQLRKGQALFQTLLQPQLELERKKFEISLEEIITEAHNNNEYVKVLCVVEEKFSEEIYKELLKRVNFDLYDEYLDYVQLVFSNVFRKYLHKFLAQVWNDKKTVHEVESSLRDPYSLAFFREAWFPYMAKTLEKTASILQKVFGSDPKAKEFATFFELLSTQFTEFSKMKPKELKRLLRDFRKTGLPQFKRMMKKL